MSISTYAQLTSAVSNWLHRSDVSTYAADFITLGESRIYNKLRIHAMQSSISSTVTGGVVATPSDYLELTFAYLNTTPVRVLERKDAEWIYRMYPNRTSAAPPKFIAVDGSNFIFGPYPDSSTTYVLTGRYYAQPSALSTATNTIFTRYPGLYLFAALAEAAPFLKDKSMVPLWEAKFKELLDRVQEEDDREEFSGSILSVVAG